METIIFNLNSPTCKYYHIRYVVICVSDLYLAQSLQNEVKTLLQKFILTGNVHQRNLVTLKWNKVWLLRQEGRLGNAYIKVLIRIAILELTWDFLFSTYAQYIFMHYRILKTRFVSQVGYTSSSILSRISMYIFTIL